MLFAKTFSGEYVNTIAYLEDYCYEGSDYIIDGRRDWQSFNTDLLDMVKKAIDNYYELEYGYCFDHSIKEYAEWYLPRKNGKAYTPMELHKIRQFIEKEDKRALLSLLAGKPYECYTLCGCSQGDYVELYAPATTKLDVIEEIEAIYFNTGTEVMVDDTDRTITDPDEIEGFTFYTRHYAPEDIKARICEGYTDLTPDDITLWLFDGYTRIPKYKHC